MCVLIVTDLPVQTKKLQSQLENLGIKSVITKTKQISKKWLNQFSLIYIHPLIQREYYERVIEQIRQTNWQVPILIPFKPTKEISNSFTLPHHITTNEVTLTIQALLNRNKKTKQDKIKYKDIEIDPNKRTAKRKNKIMNLRNKEFGILEILIKNPGAIITKNEFTEILWDRNTTLLSNTLEVHIASLRKKIDIGFPRKLIHTIQCVGYKLEYEE